ncbi:MFS transporter [Streptomyces sp. NPDC006512]|uniref:MDR family MFS transporter n=1 Tax=Streptomyces sp. NPDC006512 TaxID=3154307 RepID=UPI0033AB42E8
MKSNALLLPVGLRGLPPAFWWIWASILVNWLGAFAGPMLALSLTEGQGHSLSYAGFVVSLLGAGAVAGSAVGGVLADRLGRRATMFAGHCFTAVSMTALGLCEDRRALAVAALAAGLGAASVRPAAQAALADVVAAEDRQRAFGLNYWAVNTGTAVSAALAGLLVGYGYTPLFLADAATTLLCAVVILVKVPETRPERAATPPAGPLPQGSGPVAPRADRSFPLFVLFVVLVLVFGAVYEQKAAALPVVMTQDGHAPAVFGLLMSLNALLIVILQIPLTRLLRSRSRALVLLVGGALAGGGFGLTAVADSAVAFAFTVVVWTFGEMLFAPTVGAVAVELAPVHRRGRYLGLYGAAWSGAAFVGPAGGGRLLDHWGPGALWPVCAVAGTAAGAGCALIVRRHKNFRAATPVPEGDGGVLPPSPAPAGTGRGTSPERITQ